MAGAKIGRPREDHVKRDVRWCFKHGHTEFSGKVSGANGQSLTYSCMKCDNDRTKQRNRDIKAGVVKPNPRKTVTRRAVPFCTNCKTDMPISGVCETC